MSLKKFTLMVHNQRFSGDNVSNLLRLASRVCNNYYNTVDECTIVDWSGISCKFTRINNKYPNNTITRGKWH